MNINLEITSTLEIYVIKFELENQAPHVAYSNIFLSMQCFPKNNI